jgi:serine/threonine-protein kinase
MSSKALTALAARGGALQFGSLSRVDPDPESAQHIRRARRVGKYELGRQIAHGDMAAIHFGMATRGSRASGVVAIKRLYGERARNRALEERFRSEARINARVRDPHVVRLLDLVESEGELWQVLEYIDGETLLALQTDAAALGQKLPIPVSVAILVGALRGLHAAHSARHVTGLPLGIVHRAVTPRSIMIARSGSVKIIGFGAAKTEFASSSLDVAQLDGKVSYLSPEQVRRAPVDRRSDVFAAGVVLWEALTGRSLFGDCGETEAGILDNIENQPIPPPSTLSTEIPRALDRVVLRALRREPAHRFESALEFGRALEEVLPPASEAVVGTYLSLFCEARLARRKDVIRASKIASAELDELGSAASSRQALGKDEDEDEDEITLIAIPSLASESSVRSPGSTAETAPEKARDRTLWACAGAFALLVLTCVGWRNLRPPPSITQPDQGSPTATLPPAPVPASKPLPITPTDSDGPARKFPQADLKQADLKQADLKQADLKQAEAVTSRPAQTSDQSAGPAAGRRRIIAATTQAAPPPVKRSSTAHSVSPAKTKDCTPPTYLGSDGIHHFKEKCL